MSIITVNYFPETLSEELRQLIRENIHPSMTSEDSNQYQCDYILEQFWNIQAIVDACEWVDYLEL